jgi:predicted metalloprotease
MGFDDQQVDVSGVDDRRGGMGGGALAAGGGGIGVVGVIIYVLVQLLGGGGGSASGGFDVTGLQGVGGATGTGTGETAQQLSERCNSSGAIEKYDDCYIIKSYNEINEVWTTELQRRGETYSDPRLSFFSAATTTGCGRASASTGPFYCPPDQEVFMDLDFLAQLQSQFGAEGRYAQSYIVAHEVGHHLQNLFGTEAKVRQAQQANPRQTNALSVQLELQADCYAGAYGKLANEHGNQTITPAELDQALNAAAAVGDDAIQRQTSGTVNPDSFTHGTSAQRRSAFSTGYANGNIDDCQISV